jgi:hypothetical protein
MDLLGYERTEIIAYRNTYRGLPEIRALEMREAEEFTVKKVYTTA